MLARTFSLLLLFAVTDFARHDVVQGFVQPCLSWPRVARKGYRPRTTIEKISSRGETEKDGALTESTDWLTAEFTVRTFPTEPSPDLDPGRIAISCLRSLQFVDYPEEGAGLQRCFPFMGMSKGSDSTKRW